ncbi:hypothetical protein AAG906_001403 [Vitis piasezkii]
MDGRTISTNIESWFSRSCKRRPDRVSGHTLRWFCQPWLERIISWLFTSAFSSAFCFSSFVSEFLGFLLAIPIPFQPQPKKCLGTRKLLHLARPEMLMLRNPWIRAIQCWAPVPPPVIVQGIPSLHSDSSGLHPSQHGPGADGVQHSEHVLVTSLPDSTKGAAKGHVLVKGLWAGLTVHPDRQFAPNQSLKVPDKDKRGKLVEWVEKASFDQLNRLFEIAAAERSCETLLSTQNIRLVVAGEHFVLKDLSFYAAVRKADARSRKACLNKREEKRQEGLLRKAPGDKRPASSPPVGAPAKKKKKVLNKGKEIKLPTPPKEVVIPPPTYVKGVTIRTPDPSVLPSVSSGSGRLAGLNHSGPSMPAAGRLALLAEEATSVNQPGSPHPDADVVGASCTETLPPTAPPMEETGCKSGFASFYKEVSSGPRLKVWPHRAASGSFSGNHRSHCSSVQEDHPEGSETEMAEENPTAPTQPAENDGTPDPREESHPTVLSGGSPVDDAACISASPFSYAELGEMLKRIPPGSDVDVPSAKMFEAAEMLVSGIRGMAQQRDLFRTANYMKAFVSQRKDSEEELRLRLEQAEASLSAAQDDNEALRIELAEAKSREESTDARLHEAEDEMAQLRGEVRRLRTDVSIEKKQREDLQSRLSVQKEELETEFAAEREELEADYQKQVDEMYFFGYRCCMKKHGIKRDVPSIPSGEEEKLRSKPSQ